MCDCAALWRLLFVLKQKLLVDILYIEVKENNSGVKIENSQIVKLSKTEKIKHLIAMRIERYLRSPIW